ncbi:hypothetical protein [Coleofasciculus sp. FACHB-T130]|uniref:hypothetical protein n=1 Tax=Cyanophyceae TaxID=3028117 RepID=UPI001684D9FE|nr:hypothetical protein [Coleofasciculus sp. FACHB-T130]MBD1879792.1 hypothetical protein [Coleofasciculus sp. FACHB-T130]
MTQSNQPFDRHDENTDRIPAQSSVPPADTSGDGGDAASDAANEETDAATEESGVQPTGTRRRVANAALAGATFGAVVSAAAAAFTGKSVGEGIKAIVEGAADLVIKGAAAGVHPTIEGAIDSLKGAATGVHPTIEDPWDTHKGPVPVQPTIPIEYGSDTLQSPAAIVQPPIEDARDTLQSPAVIVQPPIEDARDTLQSPAEPVKTPVSPVDAIPQLNPPPAASATAASATATGATGSVENDVMNSSALVQLLLNQVGSELAMSFYEQLPAIVLAEIQRLSTNPTPEEQQRIRDSWTKALEPIAIAIIQSGQLFKSNALYPTNNYPTNNGYQKYTHSTGDKLN